MRNWTLSGYKTYTAGAVLIALAAAETYLNGELNAEAIQHLSEGLGLIGIRHAIG